MSKSGTSTRSARDQIAEDLHSRLNVVAHRQRIHVTETKDVIQAVAAAGQNNPLIAAGGRHAMGGQQFLHDGVLLDMRSFNRVSGFDSAKGTIRVEPGIMWKQLINELGRLQQSTTGTRWAIVQKPTGADDLTVGGCLSANVHGRGLQLKPFVQDIEEFELVTAGGDQLSVNRNCNPDLFRLVVGGYGLFGVVTSITLRLCPRQAMRRHVQVTTADKLMPTFEKLIAEGHQYGDFQFAIDDRSSDFLHLGILASYKPCEEQIDESQDVKRLDMDDWKELLKLTHSDKSGAYKRYREHYLATDGQTYWSDTMQLSTYMDDYHRDLEKILKEPRATEIITELYVPRSRLATFLGEARQLLVKRRANVIYGTIRLIEKDDETFLPWARHQYACVIFNLHTRHGSEELARTAETFRQLIGLASAHGGSFYLTYHRYVDRATLEECYPQFEEFLRMKTEYDPKLLFQSQWFRHYQTMFS